MAWGIRFIVTCLLTALSAQADARTLKIATIAPDGTIWMEEMRNGAEMISARTDGRVSFRFYPGGIMGNDESVLRKMRIRQLQGGALTGGGLAEIHPDTQVYGLPLLFRSYAEVDYVRQRMDGTFIEAMERKGFVSFGFGETGFAYLMSNRPVRRADDLRGQKAWIPQGDRISRAAFEAIDVSPIPLPLTDVLTGLQTGLVDTVASSPLGAIALQWHTRVSHLTDTPLVYLYGALVMNRRAFEKLSAQDQAVVNDVMKQVTRALNRDSRKSNEKAREILLRKGIDFVRPSEQDREHWHNLIAPAMERLARQGVFSQGVLRTLQGHLQALRSENGAFGE